jgi:acetylornithine/succinyldiaminopimelate/putrescine aminotransferase
MDACHASAVLGHNDPTVVTAIRSFLASGGAGPVHHVSIPRESAQLCERLSVLLPGPDRSVSLTASGEESLQVALRTAYAATGRPGYLSLDVVADLGDGTGPGMVRLPHAVPPDLARIEAALDADVGAIVVEPLVDESRPDGVEQARELYGAVQALCARTGTVFVVDERLTAMRTAPLVAYERLGLDPDIVCLGESLGAAMVPIGAACIRQEVWETASRHFPGSPVGISPISGSNLGAVGALATLERTQHPDFWPGVRDAADALVVGLQQVVARHAFARSIRGTGLLWHVRFAAPLTEALEGLLDDVAGRSPGALWTMLRELPVPVRETASRMSELFSDALEQFVFDRLNTKLAQDHQILIDRTRRVPRTLLVSPPLTIDADQIGRFVRALDEGLTDLSTFDVPGPGPGRQMIFEQRSTS